MSFAQVWFTGYTHPGRLVQALSSKPAPHWGFYAQLLRGLLDSLLLYLPLALLGRQPPTPSFLSFLPTETYYFALVGLAPLVLSAEWLLGAALAHLILRLSRRPSNIDQILNLTGMSALVVGAFLLVWDWTWLAIGGMNQYFLGISHLLIDTWGIAITVTGLKRILGVPVWLGILLNILLLAAAMPLAIMFMRAPF